MRPTCPPQATHLSGCVCSIYEQYSAQEMGLPVQMIMPPEAYMTFIRQLNHGKTGMEAVVAYLTTIDIAGAKASNPNDLEKVRDKIRPSVWGEAGVNLKVKESIRSCLKAEFDEYFELLEASVWKSIESVEDKLKARDRGRWQSEVGLLIRETQQCDDSGPRRGTDSIVGDLIQRTPTGTLTIKGCDTLDGQRLSADEYATLHAEGVSFPILQLPEWLPSPPEPTPESPTSSDGPVVVAYPNFSADSAEIWRTC